MSSDSSKNDPRPPEQHMRNKDPRYGSPAEVIALAKALKADENIWSIILRVKADLEFTEDEYDQLMAFQEDYFDRVKKINVASAGVAVGLLRRIASGTIASLESRDALDFLEKSTSVAEE